MRYSRWFSLVAIGLSATACSPEMTTDPGSSPNPRGPGLWTSPGPAVAVKPSSLNGACQTAAAPFYCYTAFPDGWLFYNDEIDAGDPTLGSFVSGPGTPAAGTGSVQISVSGTQRRNLATYQFAGTPLADITAMGFSTYNPSAGNGGSATRSGYLQFNVDFDGSDTWQRRLLFLPGDNGAVIQNTWQGWNAINGGAAFWRYSGPSWPVTGEPGTTTKTWNQILTDYPGARIRPTDGQLSIRVGEPYADGYTENLDAFVFGTASGTTTYDFELDTQWGACVVDENGTTYALLADCTTSQTLLIPNGYTIDGNGFTITAVDPVGGHFLGAVVMNAGTLAHVTDVTITASALANVCDAGGDRLRGILFDGAAGSITGVTVTGVRQGLSGCQEGNAIEVRNLDAQAATQLAIRIANNSVANYMKNGVTANGNVAATIVGNTVAGDGVAPHIAQNGVQVGFGATALVEGNSISGNFYGGEYWIACGLLMYEATGIKQKRNSFSGNQKDLCNFGGRGGGNYNIDQ